MFQETYISYGYAPSPYGEVLVACSDKGVCWLSFITKDKVHALSQMKKRLNPKGLGEDKTNAKTVVADIFDNKDMRLDLRGTDFQMAVWDYLLTIPKGETISYQDIADSIGKPKAVRAIGSAVGANPVSIVVPCHRVIRKDGGMGGYAWGVARKQQILQNECNTQSETRRNVA